MTVQQSRFVQFDEGDIVIYQRGFVILWMNNNLGNIADLFSSVRVEAMPVAQADSVVFFVQDRADTVGSGHYPLWVNQGTSTKEFYVFVAGVKANLPGPRSVGCINAVNNTTLRYSTFSAGSCGRE